jgi:hypothetical protein
MFFNVYHLSISIVAMLIFKGKLLIRFPDLLGHIILLFFLKLLLDKIAKTIIFLTFLQLFPRVRTESVIHLAPLLLLQLYEGAGAK